MYCILWGGPTKILVHKNLGPILFENGCLSRIGTDLHFRTRSEQNISEQESWWTRSRKLDAVRTVRALHRSRKEQIGTALNPLHECLKCTEREHQSHICLSGMRKQWQEALTHTSGTHYYYSMVQYVRHPFLLQDCDKVTRILFEYRFLYKNIVKSCILYKNKIDLGRNMWNLVLFLLFLILYLVRTNKNKV